MENVNQKRLFVASCLAIYGYIFRGQQIPVTERVSSGVSYKEMLRNVGAPFTILERSF
ncbi:MAG: hypothetical protein M0Q53_17135 [Prolixibacteraceae bacterium]|jgi:hypothetical protein|nr:hypothetical protein [Prolixibacteraceae bacterium]